MVKKNNGWIIFLVIIILFVIILNKDNMETKNDEGVAMKVHYYDSQGNEINSEPIIVAGYKSSTPKSIIIKNETQSIAEPVYSTNQSDSGLFSIFGNSNSNKGGFLSRFFNNLKNLFSRGTFATIPYTSQCSLPACDSGYTDGGTSCDDVTRKCTRICSIAAHCGTYGSEGSLGNSYIIPGSGSSNVWVNSPSVPLYDNMCYKTHAQVTMDVSSKGTAGSYTLRAKDGSNDLYTCKLTDYQMSQQVTPTLERGRGDGSSVYVQGKFYDYGGTGCSGNAPLIKLQGTLTVEIKWQQAPWIAASNSNKECTYSCTDSIQCGTNGWTGATTCSGGNVYQPYTTYLCSNYVCSSSSPSTLKQTCPNGCLNGVCSGAPSDSYCTSTSWFTGKEWIKNFKFANLNVATGASSTGYESLISNVASVTKGQSYTMELTRGAIDFTSDYGNSVASTSKGYFTVWIDWNHNNIFDSTEKQDLGYCTGNNCVATGSVTIPSSALTGNTRMRIVNQLSSYSGTACGVPAGYYWGETEDYTISITEAMIPPVEPQYCTSKPGYPGGEWIESILFSNLDITSGSSATGYADLTNNIASVNLGQTYPIQVVLKQVSSYTGYVTAWIDWNQDKIFQSTEKKDLSYCSGSLCTLSSSITVPLTALEGNTRMRLVEQRHGYSGLACGNMPDYYYGEVEDYTLSVSKQLTLSFDIGATNTGDVAYTDVKVSSATPTSLKNALPTTSYTLPAGATQLFKSSQIIIDPTWKSSTIFEACISGINPETLQPEIKCAQTTVSALPA